MKLTAIILSGGKSRRFGRTKALETIDGKSIIEHVIEHLKPLTDQILVVTAQEQIDNSVNREVEVLVDAYPGKGPLGGIYTGLVASRSPRSIVVACDMPFLNARLLKYLSELSSDFDAVVPRLSEGRLEPLHAVYSKSCLGAIEAQLQKPRIEAYSFLDEVRVRYVEPAECQQFDPKLLSFFNINYQADLDQAIVLAVKNRSIQADR